MTSAENSVSEPPNLKIFWEKDPDLPPLRGSCTASALAIMSCPYKKPSYSPEFLTENITHAHFS